MTDISAIGPKELMVAAGAYGCFEVRMLSPRCKRKQTNASTINSRGTALVTQVQYHESSLRSTGMARNQRLTTKASQSQKLQYSVSYKRAPRYIVHSQSQLECISP